MNKELEKYQEILDIFLNNSYQVYFVGGCVRDSLLERKIIDVDIVTDATPWQTKELFFSFPMDLYALKYGCVILKGDLSCQITTLRVESNYNELRQPETIRFVKDLKMDAKRRDFTINSLYMDKKGEMTDFFQGKEDLDNRLIRIIGNCEKKIQEDPLRIIRALRFADLLDFELDFELEEEIKKSIDLIKKLKNNVIVSELSKYKKKGKYYQKYLKKQIITGD